MIYGYARVSTAKQMKNGNSLQDQIEKLTAAGAQTIFQDSYRELQQRAERYQ